MRVVDLQLDAPILHMHAYKHSSRKLCVISKLHQSNPHCCYCRIECFSAVVICSQCSKASDETTTRVACVKHADRLCLPSCTAGSTSKGKRTVRFLPVCVKNLENLQSATAERVRRNNKWLARKRELLNSPFTVRTTTATAAPCSCCVAASAAASCPAANLSAQPSSRTGGGPGL